MKLNFIDNIILKILISIFLGLVYIVLLVVPYINILDAIFAGIFFSYNFTKFADFIFHLSDRQIWYCRIILGILIFLIHLGMAISCCEFPRGPHNRKKDSNSSLKSTEFKPVITKWTYSNSDIENLKKRKVFNVKLYQRLIEEHEILKVKIDFIENLDIDILTVNKINDSFKEIGSLLNIASIDINKLNNSQVIEMEQLLKKTDKQLNEIRINENKLSCLLDTLLQIYGSNMNNSFKKQPEKNSFNPFAGCTDEESLKKRYRDLSKSFHPDMSSGDNESMQFINSEYERLLEKYK